MISIEDIANDNGVFIASEEFQKVNTLMLMRAAVEKNNLTSRAKEYYQVNKDKGFHDVKQHPAVYLMLIVSELSEALEADRNGRYTSLLDAAWMKSCADPSHLYEEHFPMHIKDTLEDEIADALIRILDFCGLFDIDIESHVEWKLEYNKTRSLKHGKKY